MSSGRYNDALRWISSLAPLLLLFLPTPSTSFVPTTLPLQKIPVPTSYLSRRNTNGRRTTTFAAGFGGGGASGFGVSKSDGKNKKKSKKSKKSLKKSVLSEMMTPTTTSSRDDDESKNSPPTPLLDRFGLPIPTPDNIFPPLPPDTEIIPVDDDEKTTKEELRDVLDGYLGVNLAAFDDDGRAVVVDDAEGGVPPRVRLLHRSPPVLAIDDFFTPEDCEEYIALTTAGTVTNDHDGGTPREKKVMKVNSATFSPLSQSKRTSTTWFCHYSSVPTLLAKMTHYLGVSLDQCEEPQLVRYRNGEEFSWHYDEIPPTQLPNGGQRIATLLIYLNTLGPPTAGGGTVFRDLIAPSSSSSSAGTDDKKQLTMTPRRGTALLFFPSRKDGTPDDRTLHKGEVVTGREEKMIAQVWVHEREYEASVPPGNGVGGSVRELVLERRRELGLELVG